MMIFIIFNVDLTEYFTNIKMEIKKSKRKKFTKEEDLILINIFSFSIDFKWEKYSKLFPNRTERQCKERYKNYLANNILNNEWTEEEDEKLISYIKIMGLKWVKLTEYFPTRSANNLKNRWYKHLSKKIPTSEMNSKMQKRHYSKHTTNFEPKNHSNDIIDEIFDKILSNDDFLDPFSIFFAFSN